MEHSPFHAPRGSLGRDHNRDRRLSRVIEATDPVARTLIVYDSRTGQEIRLVQRVCIREGWIDRYMTRTDDPNHLVLSPDGMSFRIERIFGPWALKPKGTADPNLGQALTRFAVLPFWATSTSSGHR